MTPNPYEPPSATDASDGDESPPPPRLVYGRAVRFGLAAGLLWSLPAILLQTYGVGVPESLTVFGAGMTAGVLTALAVARPVARWSAVAPLLFGVAGLPVGAFLFGVLLTWLQFGAMSGGEVAFRFGPGVIEPVGVGVQYALLAIARPLLPFTAPAAVATAYAMRWHLRRPAALQPESVAIRD